MPLTLLTTEFSNCSQRAIWAMNYKGMDYAILDAGTLQRDELFKLSPLGKVPSLMIDGKPLAESMAILEYIEEKFPTPPLIPADPYQKAKVREICEMVNGTIHAVQASKVTKFFIPNASEDQIIQFRKRWIETHLPLLQPLLFKESAYALGKEFSLADIFVTPIFAKGLGFGMEAKAFPLYLDQLRECRKNPAVWNACPADLQKIIASAL